MRDRWPGRSLLWPSFAGFLLRTERVAAPAALRRRVGDWKREKDDKTAEGLCFSVLGLKSSRWSRFSQDLYNVRSLVLCVTVGPADALPWCVQTEAL